MITLAKGATGLEVRALQYFIGVASDGKFGVNTHNAVMKFQKNNGLAQDGICGPNTWARIATMRPTVKSGDKGNDVRGIQVLLGSLTVDGIFGTNTRASVVAFQNAKGLTADGICGKNTWAALLELADAPGHTAPPIGGIQPVDYKQYDARWAGVVFTSTGNKSQTIKSSGCGPTAMADIIAAWFDGAITPVEMCELAVKWGCRTANSGTDWPFFIRCSTHWPFASFVQTSSTDTVVAALKNGALVVANMGPPYWTKNGHYICLWAADDTNIYANDPASSTRKHASIQSFKNESKQYFIFYR